jgi:suppressor of G2 allele of SKP1
MVNSDLVARADRAFVDEELQSAVDLYTQALASAEGSPKDAAAILASRSHANNNMSRFLEAAADATRAVELDPSSAKAFLRKG